ncbi:hypothetical protein KQX54_020013 [Cotesia glomerata]|uniref:Uncharacterized protein n=1 Tax=Cotesia glomerata TaxID=32391 RepID=A0AAV7IYK2_COTGL|nr:hypothetical protein KQX54_020013 [Cotesia glomerata]
MKCRNGDGKMGKWDDGTMGRWEMEMPFNQPTETFQLFRRGNCYCLQECQQGKGKGSVLKVRLLNHNIGFYFYFTTIPPEALF